ncbi:MAG TPA: HAD-IIB family hydrolase [Pseudogracilibacillus sp.]|nr:HAD-IIB family hydrolase [Pseudogracilibacillus sp.]
MQNTYLLATDLDDTLVGNQLALENLFEYFQKQAIDLNLIYITGRHFDSAKELITKEQLPIPDVLICDVGCSIYTQSTPNLFKKDSDWHDKLYSNWPVDKIFEVINDLNLELQDNIPLAKRISLNVDNEQDVKSVCQKLAQEELPVKTIYSSQKDLDILPSESGKGNALIYTLNNYYPNIQNVLVAGNSENDLEMLSLGYPSVIVGNAEELLLNLREMPLLYKAQGHHADGIREAFETFFKKES